MIYRNFMEAGYIIFGLNGVDQSGNCACGNSRCNAQFKHPVASNWQFSPHWSDEQIEIMQLTGQLATGYGVLVSELLVVDVDARNGGIESYDKLMLAIPEIAGTGLIVETGSGSGSRHLYFRNSSNLSLMQHVKEYPGIDFKTSGFVVGPGSMHLSGDKYVAVMGAPDDIDDAPPALIELLVRPEYHRAEINGNSVDVSNDDIAEMLSFISPDCDHDEWIKAGMSCHHATQGSGFSVWNDWSEKGDKYPTIEELEKRWHSFGKSANPVTLGTLAHYAAQGGWKSPVTFQTDIDFEASVGDPRSIDGLPFDTSGIDLLRPPDFVGVLTDWINDQCRYPREHLAVAAAISTIGTIAGMRHNDTRDGVTSNLFTFCVAASGTGKEAIGQAVTDISHAAGISEAAHGNIKSEQEVIRNLLRNQAAFYTIDEIGFLLQKIKSAQGGGASYLEGIIGVLMSAYSKSGGSLPLGGDLKEQVRAEILKGLSQANKKVDENEDKKGLYKNRIVQLEKQLENISKGLHRPFLSLIGYTTPENFSGLVDGAAVRSGFIGRSLIFQERNDNPKSKRRFRKRPMPSDLATTLSVLYTGGDFDLMEGRIEQRGSLVEIPTEAAADIMLEDALTWIEDYADIHMEKTGMTAVVRRGFEILSKVSMILAIPGGVRTAEHVRWAFAMIRRDIDDKISLTLENDTTGTSQLMRKILNLVTEDDGLTIGTIRNKLRAYRSDDIDTALESMKSSGYMKYVTLKSKAGGHSRNMWFKCRDG